ncbi:MAG: hypothetical protein AAGI45_14990 [Cyanobacteria bacterium P01_H01_bin.26]
MIIKHLDQVPDPFICSEPRVYRGRINLEKRSRPSDPLELPSFIWVLINGRDPKKAKSYMKCEISSDLREIKDSKEDLEGFPPDLDAKKEQLKEMLLQSRPQFFCFLNQDLINGEFNTIPAPIKFEIEHVEIVNTSTSSGSVELALSGPHAVTNQDITQQGSRRYRPASVLYDEKFMHWLRWAIREDVVMLDLESLLSHSPELVDFNEKASKAEAILGFKLSDQSIIIQKRREFGQRTADQVKQQLEEHINEVVVLSGAIEFKSSEDPELVRVVRRRALSEPVNQPVSEPTLLFSSEIEEEWIVSGHKRRVKLGKTMERACVCGRVIEVLRSNDDKFWNIELQTIAICCY